jgi:hypothetical protein
MSELRRDRLLIAKSRKEMKLRTGADDEEHQVLMVEHLGREALVELTYVLLANRLENGKRSWVHNRDVEPRMSNGRR